MRIIYSLPHPADRLDSQQAGHTIRAAALLAALEELGHEVVRIEAAAEQKTQTAVSTYRSVVKKLLPRPLAMKMRDAGRVAYGRRYAGRLIEKIRQTQPDVILETHIAFSLAGKIASAQTGLPLVLDDVAPAWEEEQQYGVGLKKLARNVHAQVTQQAKLLIAVNKFMRQYLIADGLPEDKIVIVENGIDGRYFHPNVDGQERRVQYGIDQNAIVIVFVGSFQPYHRVELLIQAFNQLNTTQPVHLLLVGEGRCTSECKALAQRLGVLDQITFTGRIPYHEIASYIAAGNIAIMPASNEYGNPMKLYEYMALGKAVIAPAQETITEILTHGQNAYLFERDNIQAMAMALKTVVENAALRECLGRQASMFAAEHTWQKRAESIQHTLQRLEIG